MIKKMIKEEGIGCFFKGVIPGIIMTINPVIQYIIYEYIRKRFSNLDGTFSTSNIIWASIVSKLTTTLVTYPMLTVKTLFQSNENKSTKYVIEIIKAKLKEQGIKGLYTGISAKLVQTLINNTIVMIAFEKVQSILKMVLLLSAFYKARQMGNEIKISKN
jgi:solute carrier family 25 (peroxisomal adenine nucleotide transporter), member 17